MSLLDLDCDLVKRSAPPSDGSSRPRVPEASSTPLTSPGSTLSRTSGSRATPNVQQLGPTTIQSPAASSTQGAPSRARNSSRRTPIRRDLMIVVSNAPSTVEISMPRVMVESLAQTTQPTSGKAFPRRQGMRANGNGIIHAGAAGRGRHLGGDWTPPDPGDPTSSGLGLVLA